MKVKNIQEVVQNITPEQFEKICLRYLRYTRGNEFVIKGTRYIKDGGKDISGTQKSNKAYKLWAECKKHSRSIGLEEISKNVVLILAENINELIFFSVSNITDSAQVYISGLAKKYKFNVSFYYGEYLKKALAQLPEYTLPITIDIEKVETKFLLTTYKNDSSFSNMNKKDVILNRDNIFYLNLLVRNNTCEYIHNMNIFSNVSTALKCIPEKSSIDIAPYCCLIIQFKYELLNMHQKVKIPNVIINYYLEAKFENKVIELGYADPTKHRYFPLLGSQIHIWLQEYINPILSGRDIINTILIEGGSGTGKSRALKEVIKLAEKSNYSIISIDGKTKKDYRVIKEILCELSGIPFYKGNVNFTSDMIKSILNDSYAAEEYSDILYNFIFKEKFSEDIKYYINNALIYFFDHPFINNNYVIAIDNLQDMDIYVIDIILKVIELLQGKSTNIIFCVVINTEVIPSKNIEIIKTFIDYVSSDTNENTNYLELAELSFEDAKSFYMHIFNDIDKNVTFINDLMQKSGKRPFDIIMQIKYLEENEIIKWKGQSNWYIVSSDKLDSFYSSIPKDSKKLIENRVKQQLENSKEYILNRPYSNWFSILCKSILYFGGYVPNDFLYYYGFNDNIILKLIETLLFKFDDNIPQITFYHDNIKRFMEGQKIFLSDYTIAKKILLWEFNNPDFVMLDRNFLKYKCYKDLGNYSIAYEHAKCSIESNIKNHNFAFCIEIINNIQENKKFQLSPKDAFELNYYKALSYKQRINHIKGADLFFDLFNKINMKIYEFDSSSELYKFLKLAFNANYLVNRFEEARRILIYFKSLEIVEDYYDFWINDRYALLNLADGAIEQAEKDIEQALSLANAKNNDNWRSVAYSDKGFIDYYSGKTFEHVSFDFEEAYSFDKKIKSSKNRAAELYQQKAFAELLNNKPNSAEKKIDSGIELCKKLSNTFLEARALNLKGIINFYKKDYDEANASWGEAELICIKTHEFTTLCKIYCNIGTYFYFYHKFEDAANYFYMSYEYYKKSNSKPEKFRILFNNIKSLKDKEYLNTLNKDLGEEIIAIIENTKNYTTTKPTKCLSVGDVNFIF